MSNFPSHQSIQPYYLPHHVPFSLRACLLAFCFLVLQLLAVKSAYAVQIAVGSYIGDGLVGHSITGLGFSPSAVILKGDNGQESNMRTLPMLGDASKHLSGADALKINRIQSLDNNGFTVGDDPEVNRAGDTYHWIAFGDDGSLDFKVGSYVGDGNDNRSVTGTGFPPDYVIVMSSGANKVSHRSSALAGDASVHFTADGVQNNEIQAFQVDGFQVGTDAKVNSNGVEYHYVAWRARKIAVGSYAGDGTDDRSITGVGTQPVYLIIKSSAGDVAVHRPITLLGDQTLKFGGATFADGIQALQADGFQVGTDSTVNQLTKTYYWIAFATSDFPLPVISQLTPSSGPPGTSVTVTGWSFGDTAGVLAIDDVIVTPSTWSNTSITFTVPDGAQTGPVLVTTAGGRKSQGVGFIVSQPGPLVSYFYDPLNRLKAVVDPLGQAAVYNYDIVGNLLSIARPAASQLSIFAFNPRSAPVGTSVTISGLAFETNPNANTVQFNGSTAVVTAASSSELVATVPLGVTCGPITLTTSTGSVTSEDNFCP